MKILHFATGQYREVIIEPVAPEDFKRLTVKRYSFRWQQLTHTELFKLRMTGDDDIKGIMSLIDHPTESRIEIKLLAASRENIIFKKEKGKKKKEYDLIAGNLIAFAGRIAVLRYGHEACVSLLPKTELKNHYIQEYGMHDGGYHVFLELGSLYDIINKFIL